VAKKQIHFTLRCASPINILLFGFISISIPFTRMGPSHNPEVIRQRYNLPDKCS